MKLTVNGESYELPDGTTVEDVLASVGGATRGSAVVVDGEVVPRSTWSGTSLRDGQTVEIVTAVQGG